MAVASCSWVTRDVKGKVPSPRQGHAVTVKSEKVFLFGGMTTSSDGRQIKYHNDLFSLTVDATMAAWNEVPQSGNIPCKREGHSFCTVGRKLYVYGGRDDLKACQCLPGLYSYDTKSGVWTQHECSGTPPITLNSTMSHVGDIIYVFGGIENGKASNDMYMCHMEKYVWTPLKVLGIPPQPRCDHSAAVVGDHIFIFGGCGSENKWFNDLHIFHTVTLSWLNVSVRGIPPFPRGCQTFSAHHDKDIYVFGGYNDDCEEPYTCFNDIYKLSLNKLKWKRPLYTGLLAEKRYGHAAAIVHSQLCIICGMGDYEQFNDVKVLKLINPSERKPVFMELMQECGVSGRSTDFFSTKRPQYDYCLSTQPFTKPCISQTLSPEIQSKTDLSYIRELAKQSVDKAVDALEIQFAELDRERSEMASQKSNFEKECEAYNQQFESQQKELAGILEQHTSINEDWLESRRVENDKERKEIAEQRTKLLLDQDKLLQEKEALEQKSKKLHSVMQQFKWM